MYGKIFSSMFEGSLYGNPDAIIVMMVLIVLADAEGCIDMTAAAIAARTSFPIETVRKGLAKLSEPDPNSRTDTEDGRRIVLLDDHRDWGWRLVNSMEMVAFFAATALLLAGLGIYGTISYVVNEQRREIAIRLALGAERGNILRMVLRRGLGLAAAGAGLGVAGALIVSHLMAGMLYGVSPTDLPTFAGVTLVLTTAALAASYIPALRAVRVDPIIALREA